MKAIFYLFFLFGSIQAFGQLHGTVFDSENREPIPYVNIGVLNKNLGTVSNDNGDFILELQHINPSDSIKFSVIGYEPLIFTFHELKTRFDITNASIELSPEYYEFEEMTITPKKLTKTTIGNTNSQGVISMGFSSNQLGSELGVEMKVKKKRVCYIDTLVFNINECGYDSVLFRVNIYLIDDDGKPGDSSLLSTPLYVNYKPVDTYRGEVVVDLTELRLKATGDFHVSLEWLKDLGEGRLNFPAGILNSNSFARTTSQSEWTKTPMGVGFFCKVRMEKVNKRNQ